MSEQWSEQRQVLEGMREELQQRLSAIARDIRHEVNPPEQDSEERAVERENEEVLNALDDSGKEELRAVNRALQKIESGDYGACVSCGADISAERLKAVPYTDHCIKCAE